MPRPKMWIGALHDLAQALLDAGASDEQVARAVEKSTKSVKNAVFRGHLKRGRRPAGFTKEQRAARWGKETIAQNEKIGA